MNYVRSLLSRSPDKHEIQSPTRVRKSQFNSFAVLDYETIQKEEYKKLCQLEKVICSKQHGECEFCEVATEGEEAEEVRENGRVPFKLVEHPLQNVRRVSHRNDGRK